MSDRARLAGLSVWIAVLAVVSLTVPPAHTVVWTLIGVSAVVAMVAGIVRHRPRRRGPWLLLAAAVACLAAGDLLAEVLLHAGASPFPSAADLLYLAMYLLVAGGMVWLHRLGLMRRDAAGVLDALTLTAGVGLLVWVFMIVPYVTDPELGVLEKVISAAYPLGDLLVLATVASLVASMRSAPALRLLAVGGVGLLASDIAYGIIQLYGTWRVGTPVDLGWVLFYLCWGLAALHPSMRELTEPKLLRERAARLEMDRVVLLGLASLIAPVVLAVEVLTTGVRDAVAIAILSAVLSTLVLIRLTRAVRSRHRSVLRERALRIAGAELLATTDVEDVPPVVTRAVGGLVLSSDRPHRVLLEVGPATGAQAGQAGPGDRTHAPAPGLEPAPAPGPAVVYTADLPAPVADALAGFEVVLRCVVPGRQGTSGGTLFIAADEAVLVRLQESAQVLADQIGLTLQRIALAAEVDRRNSEAYFRTLVLNMADVILILDAADRVKYASPSATTLFGVADLAGVALPDLVAPASADEARDRLAAIRHTKHDRGGPEWRVPRPGGEALVEATVRDLRGEPTVDGVVVTLRDVTEGHRMKAELYRRATTDTLTGLPNLDMFAHAVQRAVDAARHTGSRAGVVMLGLDEFKLVNNTMGHRAGDEVLAMVGRRLTEAMHAQQRVERIDSTGSTVARLGSDEFATCMRDVADQADVDRVTAALKGCFTDPFVLGKGSVTLRTSIGVAMSGGETDASELLRQADLALSVAKDAGRNRIVQYEEALHALVTDRLQLRGELERAVAEGSFILEFQPIVTLPWSSTQPKASRHTAGFEALIRWQHPERGTLAPSEFITLAEESGLIVPLGNWVLHHAIQCAVGWRGGRDSPYVSVNVSARQLRTSDFVGRVLDELAASGMPPKRLVLEITESLLVQGDITAQLARLRERGVRVAIDDFGTGFSSLSYLRQLPADVLKLDKSFAETITASEDQQAITATVTQLAHTLNLQVVAEGIETEQELAALTTSGCGFGQGYVVSRPMHLEDAVRWLHDEAATPVGAGR